MTENVTTEAGPAPTPPGPATSARPPLVRSRSNRKFAGVAGGLAQYTAVDPLVFRILFVVLTIFGGSGVLLYGLGWLLLPEEGQAESEGQRLLRGKASTKVVIAGVLVLVGLAAFGESFGSGRGFGGMVTLVAVGLTAYLLLRPENHLPGAPPQAAHAVATPAAPGAYGQTPGTAYSAGTGATATQTLPAASDVFYGPPAPPPAPRERSPLGRITASVALLVAGFLAAFDAVTSYDVPAVVVLGSALAVVGGGLIVSAFVGRARALIPLGILLAIATGIAAATHDLPLHAGTGERVWAPKTVADVRPTYELGAGKGTLDLRALNVDAGQTVRTNAHVGAGQLRVLVPQDVALRVDARAGVGVIDLPDGTRPDGVRSEVRWTDPGSGNAGTVTLRLRVNFGDVEVRRATS